MAPVLGEPLADPERLTRRLRMLAVVVRWVTLGLGVFVGVLRDPTDPAFLVATVALLVLALGLLAQPIELDPPDRRTLLTIAGELIVTGGTVAATGGVDSPFSLTPMVPIVLGGYVFALSRRIAVFLAAAGLGTAAFLIATERTDPASQRSTVQTMVTFVLAGVIGAFARVLMNESVAQRRAAEDQVQRLATANDLLVALHGVARTLPASLDLEEVVTSIRQRARALFEYTSLLVLVRDEAGGGWNAARAEGVRVPPRLTTADLPAILQPLAQGTGSCCTVDDMLVDAAPGCSPMARSGLYAPLPSRGQVVGLLAIEHSLPGRYGPPQVELLGSVAGLFGLSLDNALWFGRIRHLAAEDERARIARDLHDRIAQSLAYVAFELERLARSRDDTDLGALHGVVRDTVSELRETLYQLRSGVTEDLDLATAAASYLERFSERTGIAVDWQVQVAHRLPPQVEQELWRILVEALTNVERHSGADSVTVRWRVAPSGARLEVADAGAGFDPTLRPADRYGLLGMVERADAVGGRLTVTSRPGDGTRVTVDLPTSPRHA